MHDLRKDMPEKGVDASSGRETEESRLAAQQIYHIPDVRRPLR